MLIFIISISTIIILIKLYVIQTQIEDIKNLISIAVKHEGMCFDWMVYEKTEKKPTTESEK